MKISPSWLRDFIDLKVDEQQLARDLTMHGIAVEGTSGEGKDTVYEVEFTANRPDAMNHYGVARECSAIYDVDLKAIAVKLPMGPATEGGGATKTGGAPVFPIIIDDASGCARYTGRVIRGVKIGPSPEHVAKRLVSVDQRPINSAADATNYVLWEMGHPTHVFDLDTLEGGKIIVRRAKDGETLKTLDGVERKLSKEDLVIADARKPVALAGVMGGEDTKVTETTKNILIEAAWFEPDAVRKTARRHGLHTDASHRFERGADYAATTLACGRVAQLIVESAGGHVEGDFIDTVSRKVGHALVALHISEVKRILGVDIPGAEIERILRRLGFVLCNGQCGDGAAPRPDGAQPRPHTDLGHTGSAHTDCAEWTISIPTWRLDVEREIDLIEEIARIYGYDKFPNTLPEFSGSVIDLPDAAKDAKLHTTLLGLGYDEGMTLTFIAEEDTKKFATAQAVKIANPLSEEAGTMRNTLVPGMLNMLAWNLNRGTDDARLFEAGNVYEKVGDRTQEHKRVSMGATVESLTKHLPKGGTLDMSKSDNAAALEAFRAFKGDVESLLSAFGSKSLTFDEHSAEYYHPGRSAKAVMDGTTVAMLGQIHPDIAAERKLKQDVYVAEIYLERLYERELREPRYTRIPRYPAVDRDLSFIFDNAVTFERIRGVVDALHLPELCAFFPVEIFRGPHLPKEGRYGAPYSVLLRAEFQSGERTLRDEEVAGWAAQIVKALEEIGGTQRS
jgi:phenylalanyl-tRNA synthetase beta chain